jgi:hypothetical protein
MKRIIIVYIIVFSIISNLSAQDSKTINGTILEKKNINNHTLVSKKHEQKLTLDYSASDYQLILYNDPIEKMKIADLQRKQEITIKEIVFIDDKESWLKIQVNDKDGYIFYAKYIFDPYKDDAWMPTGEIQSGGKTFHTLKCSQGFLVYTNLRIRDKPGLDGNKIGLIEANQRNSVVVKTMEITQEKETIDGKTERWAKIEYKGITGWVFGGYLEYERGGPRFCTPEIDIEMELGAGI